MAKRPSPAGFLGTLAFHQVLVADTRRNRAFQRALAARVRPDHSVLDIGAGSGIWSVVAARLGARRVVALERDPGMRPVIERLAAENGVGDRVEVMTADARRVALSRGFDVVVSETVGSEAFDEGIIALLERARTRFLRPGGALIPETLALRGAPAAPIDAGRLSPPVISSESLLALTQHVPRGVMPGSLQTLAPSRELFRVDLHTARASDLLPVTRARFRVPNGRGVGGLAVWVDMGLAPGVKLQTRAGTTWSPLFLPVDRLPSGPGRLSMELDWNAGQRRWRIEFVGDGGARHASDHSPLFAWGSVCGALRRSGATPTKRRPR